MRSQKKTKQKYRLLLLFAAILLALYGYDKYTRFHRLPPQMQQLQSAIGIPVTEQLIPIGNTGRPGIQREVKWVVIHETANHTVGADARAHSKYILKHSAQHALSWHYTVDDHQVYHHLPDNEVGWHAGDSLQKNGGNACGIGIEICVNDDGNFEKSLENAAKLSAFLLDHYHLSTSHLKQHADFMDKNCPQTLRDSGRWEEFVQMVEKFRLNN